VLTVTRPARLTRIASSTITTVHVIIDMINQQATRLVHVHIKEERLTILNQNVFGWNGKVVGYNKHGILLQSRRLQRIDSIRCNFPRFTPSQRLFGPSRDIPRNRKLTTLTTRIGHDIKSSNSTDGTPHGSRNVIEIWKSKSVQKFMEYNSHSSRILIADTS